MCDTNVAIPVESLVVLMFMSAYTVDTIKEGYKLMFINDEPPPRAIRPNNKFTLNKPTLLWQELIRLEELG